MPDPPTPKVAEKPVLVVVPIAPQPEGVSMADQIGYYLKTVITPRGKAELAHAAGLTPNTIVRALSGTGLKLSTLEAIAKALGWTITVTDAQGNTVAKLQP